MIKLLILIKSMKSAADFLLKKKNHLKNLPPTKDALIQHVRRVFYQVLIWKTAIQPAINM